MNDIDILYNHYKSNFSTYIDTFENCSLDDSDPENKFYLSHSKVLCFNFDHIKDHIFEYVACCSMDSLYFDAPNNDLYFIEFKNTKLKTCKKNFIDSSKCGYILNRYISTFCKDVDIRNINLHSILVIPEDKNNRLIANLKAAAGTPELVTPFKIISDNIVGSNFMGENVYFKDFKIYSAEEFDEVFKI